MPAREKNEDKKVLQKPGEGLRIKSKVRHRLFISTTEELVALFSEHEVLDTIKIFDNNLLILPSNLIVLNLQNSQLTCLSRHIGSLTSLKKLNLSTNELSTLPQKMSALTGLEKLDLSANGFIQMPFVIGTLTNLRSLDLSQNQLEYIGSEIGNLAKLTDLDLSENALEELPPQMRCLWKLGTCKGWQAGLPKKEYKMPVIDESGKRSLSSKISHTIASLAIKSAASEDLRKLLTFYFWLKNHIEDRSKAFYCGNPKDTRAWTCDNDKNMQTAIPLPRDLKGLILDLLNDDPMEYTT